MPRHRIPHKYIDTTEYKYCHSCSMFVDIMDFGNNKKSWDGLYSKCRACVKKYNDSCKKQIKKKEFKLHKQNKKGMCTFCQVPVYSATLCNNCYYWTYNST